MKLNIKGENGDFNVKRLMWHHNLTIKDLERSTKLTYRKLQSILDSNDINKYKLVDILKLMDAMGYTSVDEFIEECFNAGKFKRSQRMDELLEKAIDHQLKYGTFLEEDVNSIVVEATWAEKLRLAKKSQKNETISQCLAEQEPDDIMAKMNVTALIGPDKAVLYTRKAAAGLEAESESSSAATME